MGKPGEGVDYVGVREGRVGGGVTTRLRTALLLNTIPVSRIQLGAFAKFRKATISSVMLFCPSICPHGTTRLPRDGFS
jgi:hypothetical protein